MTYIKIIGELLEARIVLDRNNVVYEEDEENNIIIVDDDHAVTVCNLLDVNDVQYRIV